MPPPWHDHIVFSSGGPTLGELTRQALSSTRAGYDLLAAKFDRTPFRTPDWLLDAVAPEIGPPGSVARGIDLCCGTGAGLRVLRPVCRELVVGVDFSLGMLGVARRRGQATPLGPEARVLLVQQDVLEMGFASTFDVATLFGALGHLRPRDQPRFLAEVRRCLAPGGRLVFVTAPVPPPWSPALWVTAGFDAAIWVRNRLWRPPFYMYYLAWPLARSLRLLRAAGFTTDARPLVLRGRATRLRVVVATRREV